MAYPVTLNGRTYTLADFEGQNYVDGLPDAFEDFVTHAGDLYNDTSTTSNSIGTGSKTFTVSPAKPYQAGTPLRIADAAAPAANFLDAVVTSYSGTTLVVEAIGYGGSGTKTSWTVNIGGAKTIDGTLGLSQGGTGATTAAAARTNLDTYSKTEADSRFLNVSGEASNVTMTGDVTIGDAAGDTLTVNATADFNTGFNVDGSITLDHPTAQNISFTNTAANPTISSVRALNIDIDSDGNQGTTAINFTHDGGAGTIATFSETGDISFYETDGSTASFVYDANAGTTFNEAGNDRDFRVESDSNSHMLFVDAGGNKVGVNSGNPTATFDVTATGSRPGIYSRSPASQSAQTNSQLVLIDSDNGNLRANFMVEDGTGSGGNGSMQIEVTEVGVSNDRDLRIQGSGKTFFGGYVGGPSRVNVADTLAITDSSGGQSLLMGNQDSGGANNPFVISAGNGRATFGNGNSWSSSSGGTMTSHLSMGNGTVVVNEDGNDQDFRVESDGNTHALFVDAGSSEVFMGLSSQADAGARLHVAAAGSVAVEVSHSTTFYGLWFARGGVQKGYTQTTSSGTTYNTTSDARLKENVSLITDGIDVLNRMRAVEFDWIDEDDAPRTRGFIAQEMVDVAPEAVTGQPDDEIMMGMDYGRITPVIVAALQEALAKIETLEARITALENS